MSKPTLERITTAYIDSEDRIRLCGETAPNQAVVLWLTQRLLNRLVPHLLTWLEQQTGVSGGIGADVRADVMHSFAQQAAMSSLRRQAPVQAHAARQTWLVHAVDVTVNAHTVRLTFRGSASAHKGANLEAAVSMQSIPLRQWLSILHEQCRRAGWASPEAAGAVWPAWLQAGQRDADSRVATLH